MLKQISIAACLIGVFIVGVGHKDRKVVAIGSTIFFLGILGIYYFS